MNGTHSLEKSSLEVFYFRAIIPPKLAHYFGFVFADHFLEHVIPGYYRDMVTTMQYDWALREYLKIDISKLA